jgi:predicted HAD superfamily phosphohydrolase YqeG
VFKEGVLFSARHPKGETLVQFLQTMNLEPAHVILIDDRIEYLESTAKAMEDLNIDFTGYHYQAAKTIPLQLDEDLARFQLSQLAQTGVWLSELSLAEKK